jgi:hypothetical protein
MRPTCTVDGCVRQVLARGFCNAHYLRWYRTGDATRTKREGAGLRRKAPNGTGTTTDQGYRAVYVGGKRTMEHRHIMEQMLGRSLLPEENVHHINGQRADNRRENLELWTRHQPTGQRVADKVAWAREILALYGEDF